MTSITKEYYQVTKNGMDIPGVRWATSDVAYDTMKIEMRCDLKKLRESNWNKRITYNAYVGEADHIGIIFQEYDNGNFGVSKQKIFIYGIRTGKYGE